MLAAILAAATLNFSTADADLAWSVAADLVEHHTPRDAGTTRGRAAAVFLCDSAKKAGADARVDFFTVPVHGVRKRMANVVAEFVRDPSAGWIVLVSHFDTKPGVPCPGANDGASTSGLLVALAGVFARTTELPCNVMLLWTDGEECVDCYCEEDGLWGSRRAASLLASSRRDVIAVICLDMLGDRKLGVSIPRNSSSSLVSIALDAAGRVGMADRVSAVPELVKDDHVPFLLKGFRAIDLIDFHYGSAPGLNDWWHTGADTMDKVASASLRASARLVLEMIAALTADGAI